MRALFQLAEYGKDGTGRSREWVGRQRYWKYVRSILCVEPQGQWLGSSIRNLFMDISYVLQIDISRQLDYEPFNSQTHLSQFLNFFIDIARKNN